MKLFDSLKIDIINRIFISLKKLFFWKTMWNKKSWLFSNVLVGPAIYFLNNSGSLKYYLLKQIIVYYVFIKTDCLTLGVPTSVPQAIHGSFSVLKINFTISNP